MGGSVLHLLEKLSSIQEESFQDLKGLFPSQRSHPFGYKREDYSAYFTATLYHSLARLIPYLSENEKEILENIRQKACFGVSPFQNKQGLPRYNFWQTNPGRHFPNGYLLGRWDYFRPPDDVDDSVMIYQLQNRNKEDAFWLKQHIDSYANGSKKWIKNTPDSYKKLKAHCTFFCKDMPLGFDACVISNVLYFNYLFQFPPTENDLASVFYLRQMLERKDHILRPEKVAPYYPHSSIIFYHLAKLMNNFQIPELEKFRVEIKNQMAEVLQKPLFKTERTMLENAWMWLFKSLPPVYISENRKGKFYFFVLPLTLEFEGWIPQFLAHQRISHLQFHCEALEIAFEIENLTLRNLLLENKTKSQPPFL